MSDSIDKIKQFLANCYHAGYGALDKPVPYPDMETITVGDFQQLVDESASKDQKIAELERQLADDDEPDRTCKYCNGNGGDPMCDYVLPCEHCDGEGYI